MLYDPRNLYVDEADLALFHGELASFVPPQVFDIHAHLWDFVQVEPDLARIYDVSSVPVGLETYRACQLAWMGDKAPQNGLFFPFPSAMLDVEAANTFLHQELAGHPQPCGLMMITPQLNSQGVEQEVVERGWKGFKVYHQFAARPDTFNADIGEFLPEWGWDIAHRYGLVIMLHMVKARALADEANQIYLKEHCLRYPGANLMLAHAARGFCPRHTVEGLPALRGLENVYFDTSTICEATALQAILEEFGPSRLLYGGDFPISDIHGRCTAQGDGFLWTYEMDKPEWGNHKPTLIGIESLLALKQAATNLSLNGADLEQIFYTNALGLLDLPGARTAADEQQLYREAKRLMPGGTQLLSKRPEMFAPEVWPPYFEEARGCEVKTLNGRWLQDFSLNGIGSCLLGYAHPHVVRAVQRRVRLGAMSTLNPPEEVELARRLVALHPWAQQARFARTGGEAMGIAVRIARAGTGRDAVAVCGYHGWLDWYLAANLGGEGNLTGHLLPGLQPTGLPHQLAGTVFPFAYNNVEALTEVVRQQGSKLAAIVVETTRNFAPDPAFLTALRLLSLECGATLICDEITIGFRLCNGGAHLRYQLEPDMAVYAKTLGNGHPMAAVLGRAEVMSAAERSFISSSYWTESVGPTAALAALDVFASQDVPAHVERIGLAMRQGLAQLAAQHAVPLVIGAHPCVTTLSFEHPQAAELLTLYTTSMLEAGFLTGGAFYPTLAHRQEHVEVYLEAASTVLARLGVLVATDQVAKALTTPVKHTGFKRLS